MSPFPITSPYICVYFQFHTAYVMKMYKITITAGVPMAKKNTVGKADCTILMDGFQIIVNGF